MSRFCYRVFGLGVHSELELPELPAVDCVADVVVRVAPCAVSRPTGWQGGACYHATSTSAFIHVDRVGTFVASQGCEITVQPEAGSASYLVGHVLLALAMSAILHQRGLLVLHASVVALEGRAVALVGDKGWGKSTLAAALCAKGFALVTDDVAAIHIGEAKRLLVYPAIPHVKLWPDASIAVGIDPDDLSLVDPKAKKRLKVARDQFVDAPMPLDRIYVLANRPHERVDRLPAREGFLELVRHTYPTVSQILTFTGGAAEHFQTKAAMAAGVPIFRLSRPPALDALAGHADMIQASLLESASGDETS